MCVVFDDFELSNYYLSLSSLWLLHNLPEGALLLGSAQDLSPPPACCGAHILFLCVLCIADSTLLISACRRGHRITSRDLTVHLSTYPSLHTPHLCFLSSRRYQIGNGWPACLMVGVSKQERNRNGWPELSPCSIPETELGILSPSFHLIILEKQILSFPFYT